MLGNFQFLPVRATRQLLHGTAITIAGREVESREERALVEPRIDQTDAFEQLRPIDTRDEVHAGDDVAHGNVGGPLMLLGSLHHIVDRAALRPDFPLKPVHHGIGARIQTSQALGQLGDEGVF